MTASRIESLRALLKKHKLPALLVTIPANRFYLSGFTPEDGQMGESAGALLISQRAAIILTDFRYQLTAESQAENFELRVYQSGLAQELALALKSLRIKTLGVEAMGLLLAQMRQLEEKLPLVNLVPVMGLVESLRMVKERREITLIKKSLHIMEAALASVFAGAVTGQSELALSFQMETKVRASGGDGFSFEPIVAGGKSGAEPHAHASAALVKAGKPLVVDVGARYKKYMSDITRTYLPGGGKPDANWRKVYPVVYAALQAALGGIRPGMTGRQADALARDVISRAGYGKCFGHSLGHGVGLMVHEGPSLSPRSGDVLKEGMVFTLEPGIYLPGWGGVRLEQLVALTARGARLLNQYDGFYHFES